MMISFSDYKTEWFKRCDDDDHTTPTFEQYLHAISIGRKYSAIYDAYGFLREDY